MNNNVKYAGFWVRVIAAIIDSIWLLVPIYFILYKILGVNILAEEQTYSVSRIMVEMVLPAVIVIVLWVIFSSTPGKMLFGIKIVDAKTHGKVSIPRLIVRYLSYYISMLPFFIGIFWVGWDKKKQGWHDKIAGTVVIRK